MALLANGLLSRTPVENRLAKLRRPAFNHAELTMPTYDYVCTKCGHEMEAFQSMKDEPLKKCPSCRKPALKRKVGGGAGLIFKGTGFYLTDYKKPAAPKESGGGEAKPAAAKTETKAGASAAAAK